MPLSSNDRDEVSFFLQYYEDIDIPMFLCADEGTIWWTNRALEDFTGINRDILIGTPCTDLFVRFTGGVKAAGDKELPNGIYHFSPPGKNEMKFDISSTPINRGPATGGRLYLLRDITDALHREEIIAQNKALQNVIAGINPILTDVSGEVREEAVQKVLKNIGECIAVERCYLYFNKTDGAASGWYEWSRADTPPSPGFSGVRMFEFPDTPGREVAPDSIYKTVHTGQNLQTELIPLRGKTLQGFMGFEAQGEIPHLQHSAGLVRLAGELVINALERQFVEEVLSKHDTLCESVMLSSSIQFATDWEGLIADVLGKLGAGAAMDRVSLVGIPGYRGQDAFFFEWKNPKNKGEESDPLKLWTLDGTIQWTAALSLGHVITGNVGELNSDLAMPFRERGTKSFVIVPVITGNSYWGYLFFEDFSTERTWRKPEVDALKTAADSIGSTIDRQNREIEIQDHNRGLSVINQIISSADTSKSYTELLEKALERVSELTEGTKGGVAYILEDEGEEAQLRRVYGTGEAAGKLPDIIGAADPLNHRILREKDLFETDISESQFIITWIPLPGGKTTLGALGIIRYGRSLSQYELKTLETVGSELGAAIDKIRLHKQLKESYEKANLYLDIMAHDIKNATTVSIMYSDMLREMVEGEAKDYAEKLMESIRRTIDITDHVSTIRRLHEEKPLLVPMDLNSIIQHEIEHHPETTIQYSAGSYMVMADDLVTEIFANLIGNSIKHGGNGVEIMISAEARNRSVEVSVEDTGPGIPDDLKEVIFDRFQRGGTNRTGRGLGLYIVKMLVDRYGGTLQVIDRVESKPEQGAAFRFTLKQAL